MPLQPKGFDEEQLKPQVELYPRNVMPVAPNNRQNNGGNVRNNAAQIEVKRAMENNAGIECPKILARKGNLYKFRKIRYYCTHSMGNPLPWIPMFSWFGLCDDFEKRANIGGEAESPLTENTRNPFLSPELEKMLESEKDPISSKKDQASQTHTLGEPCPLCMREEYRRTYGILNLPPFPSVVDPASCNEYTREESVECPDTTYYDSSQFTYFRAGNYVYRGWTYTTPDGRVEHMPRVPQPIHIDYLRVDPAKRSPAPQ